MKYPVAERFKAPQGEGLFTGTPMAFIRFVGCSVGKKICQACDTDFETCHQHLGGGMYTIQQLLEWVDNYQHICLTGGEPLDRDLMPFFEEVPGDTFVHIETSGTMPFRNWQKKHPRIWVCVSPKPGYLEEMIDKADEIKVILGGLGDGKGWPTVADALEWAKRGKLVYLQPRNNKLTIDAEAMKEVICIVDQWPQLRLSAQLHKYISTR